MNIKKSSLEKSSASFYQIIRSTQFSLFDHRFVDIDEGMTSLRDEIQRLKTRDKHIYLAGNGGSAAVAAHICTDLLNVGRLKAHVIHEPAQLSCFCNDYGYAHGYARPLEILAQADDLFIAISSSGQSDNLINAVTIAREKAVKVLTLSGFSPNNPLRKLGDWNIWLDSDIYGFVEIGHLFLLHHLCNQLNQT